MFKPISFMGAALLVAVLASGCAGPTKKLGRGVNNALSPISLAEWQRTVIETELYPSDSNNFPTGMIRGFNRTVARAGLGVYEIVTFPIPTYDPIWTSYLTPNPQYPIGKRPGLPDGPTFSTDNSLGFSGGDIAPILPGSGFRVFDN